MGTTATLVWWLSGQELKPESYAICKADMLIKGQDINSICFGNTLSDDQLSEQKYDYMLSNPPFGVEWKKIKKEIKAERKAMGFTGRFGPGLPRVSDESLLFLLHLISKMRPSQDGVCRFASSSMDRRSLQAGLDQERASSENMCWRMISWRGLLLCLQTCSTTQELAPISGS